MVRYTAEMVCAVSWKPGTGRENRRTVNAGTAASSNTALVIRSFLAELVANNQRPGGSKPNSNPR